jgi:hypothetical protein
VSLVFLLAFLTWVSSSILPLPFSNLASFRCDRPSQLSLCARMKFIMFLRFIISSSSWLFFMRHIQFSLFGTNIFLKIFLSNTISLLIMASFNIPVSHKYVTIGLITELYSFNFALFDMRLLWNIFLFAKYTLFPKAILSYISSSIVLSVLPMDPRYLNDLTCSSSLFWIFIGVSWSCLLVHFMYFVLCTFTITPILVMRFLIAQMYLSLLMPFWWLLKYHLHKRCIALVW